MACQAFGRPRLWGRTQHYGPVNGGPFDRWGRDDDTPARLTDSR
ncbi:MAG: hypothetical protein R3B90_18080 [Planctomycetaceae bacterium]